VRFRATICPGDAERRAPEFIVERELNPTSDLLYRWFVGLGVDDPAWDHSSFTKNRDRLLKGEIAAKFLRAVATRPK
jgi:transposase